MKPLILIAEEGERKLIDQYLPQIDAEILVTGVGAFNVISKLKHVPTDRRIINIGYAGSSNFAIGSLVMVTESRLNHPQVSYDEPIYQLQPLEGVVNAIPAVCYSGTDFVTKSDFHDCAFDMELAFIMALGFSNISSIKIISDNLSLHDYHAYGSGVEKRVTN